jgi:transcriptional regulator with XRE-family HTH domain
MGKPNRIQEQREAAGMTLETLADLAGISPSYLSRMERGDRNVSLKNLEAIANALRVSQGDLVLVAEAGTTNNEIIVVGKIGAGAEILPEFEQVPPDGLYSVETPLDFPKDVIAFEVEGESMWPKYDPGDIIVVRASGDPIEEVIGWNAAVQTEDGHRYLKRVLKASEKGYFDLESHNAAPIRGVRLTWASGIFAVIPSQKWRRLNGGARDKLLKKTAQSAR